MKKKNNTYFHEEGVYLFIVDSVFLSNKQPNFRGISQRMLHTSWIENFILTTSHFPYEVSLSPPPTSYRRSSSSCYVIIIRIPWARQRFQKKRCLPLSYGKHCYMDFMISRLISYLSTTRILKLDTVLHTIKQLLVYETQRLMRT